MGQLLLRLMVRLRRAKADPDAFIAFCFADPNGRPLEQSQVHRELQAFLTANPRALVELPRDHGKTTQVSGRLVWELGRDPSLRIKIVCATEALAAERGRFLRRAIEENPRVRALFPGLRGRKPWQDVCFTVDRPANVIGASVTSVGVRARTTGTRADLLVCDDIVDVTAMSSERERDHVKEHFRNNLMNLLEPDGRFWGLCTPWHPKDLNAELKALPAFALFRRAVGDDLEPVWPERWPTEVLAQRRDEIGAASFARGYRLVPMSDDTAIIPGDTVRFWLDEEERETTILAVDPAVCTGPRSDRTAIVALAKGPGGIRCLDARAFRVPVTELPDIIADFDARWEAQAIVIESNGAFKSVIDMIQQQESFGPRIVALPNTQNKTGRVRSLGLAVNNGSFRLRGDGAGVDPGQRELLEEMTTFPLCEHDDLVDAAALGVNWLTPKREPRAF